MKHQKLSKKANTYVYGHVIKIDPKVSKNITYDGAYEILMEKWGMEGSIAYICKKNVTIFKVFRDEELIKEYEMYDVFEDGDWDWTTIYKTVLEDILKHKLFKPAKKTRKKATKK